MAVTYTSTSNENGPRRSLSKKASDQHHQQFNNNPALKGFSFSSSSTINSATPSKSRVSAVVNSNNSK
jgi:hypothetical protein